MGYALFRGSQEYNLYELSLEYILPTLVGGIILYLLAMGAFSGDSNMKSFRSFIIDEGILLHNSCVSDGIYSPLW